MSPLLTDAELSSMRATETGTLPDTGTVFQMVRVDDGRGGFTTAGTPRSGGTVACRVSQTGAASGGDTARSWRDQWVDDPLWDIVLPYGTTVQDEDRIATGGLWYAVESIVEQSWETAVHVIASQSTDPNA